jgi:transposase
VSGMVRKSNGKYGKEFKEMVVELYKSGQSVRALSSEYGISEVTVYKWIKALSPIQGLDEKLTPADVKDLRKELFRLKQENEILKKAMTIFAKE